MGVWNDADLGSVDAWLATRAGMAGADFVMKVPSSDGLLDLRPRAFTGGAWSEPG